MIADFLIHNASEVLTCTGPAPRRGRGQADAGAISRPVIASAGGRIVYVGPEADWTRIGSLAAGGTTIDAAGGAVVPGFVDPHTHLVFAGDRRDELRRRLAGETYADLAAAGGGILSTVRATCAAAEDELAHDMRRRLDEMLRCGTTTCEVKSGYGLTTGDELKMLRAVDRARRGHPVDVVATFLGAHDIPPEYRHDRAAYVALLIDEMIPAVAAQGIAQWCDVFCETGVFTPQESRAILEAGVRGGLKPRVHADELAASGGAMVAAELQARSADHLIFANDAAADALAAGGTVATLLPIAAFYLKLGRFAPARLFIDRAVPVALATDVNPGGGFSPSMPFAMTLACFAMGLTFEEALVAATLNAAYALDAHDRVGSLEPGKALDAVLVDGPAIELIRVGADPVRAVIKNGLVVHQRMEHGHAQ